MHVMTGQMLGVMTAKEPDASIPVEEKKKNTVTNPWPCGTTF